MKKLFLLLTCIITFSFSLNVYAEENDTTNETEIKEVNYIIKKPISGSLFSSGKVETDIENALSYTTVSLNWYRSSDNIIWYDFDPNYQIITPSNIANVNMYYRVTFENKIYLNEGYTISDNVIYKINGEIVNNESIYEVNWDKTTITKLSQIYTSIDKPEVSKKIPQNNSHSVVSYIGDDCVHVKYYEKWYESVDNINWVEASTNYFRSGVYYKYQVIIEDNDNFDYSDIVVTNSNYNLIELDDYTYDGEIYAPLNKVKISKVESSKYIYINDSISDITVSFNEGTRSKSLSVRWYESDDQITWNKKDSGTFLANKYYKFVFDINDLEDEYFDFSESNFVLNGTNLSKNDEGYYESHIYGPLSNKMIGIKVNTSSPEVDAKPSNVASLTSSYDAFTNNEVSVKWYQSNDNQTWQEMNTDVFVENVFYKYVIDYSDILLKPGYEIEYLNLDGKIVYTSESNVFESKIWNIGFDEIFQTIYDAWPKVMMKSFITNYYNFNNEHKNIYDFHNYKLQNDIIENGKNYLKTLFSDNTYILNLINNNVVKISLSLDTFDNKIITFSSNINNNYNKTITQSFTNLSITEEEWNELLNIEKTLYEKEYYFDLVEYINKEFYKEENNNEFVSEAIKRFLNQESITLTGYDFEITYYNNTNILLIKKDGIIYNAIELGYFGVDNRVYIPNEYDSIIRSEKELVEYYLFNILKINKDNFVVGYVSYKKYNLKFNVQEIISGIKILEDNSYYDKDIIDTVVSYDNLIINSNIINNIGNLVIERIIKELINDRQSYHYIAGIYGENYAIADIYYYIENTESLFIETSIIQNINTKDLGLHNETILQEYINLIPNEISLNYKNFIHDILIDDNYDLLIDYIKNIINNDDINIKVIKDYNSRNNYTIPLNVILLIGINNEYYDYKEVVINIDNYVIPYSYDENLLKEDTLNYINSIENKYYEVQLVYNNYNDIKHDSYDDIGKFVLTLSDGNKINIPIYRNIPKLNSISLSFDKEYIVEDLFGTQLSIIIDSEEDMSKDIVLTYDKFWLNITDDYYITVNSGENRVLPIKVCVRDLCETINLNIFSKYKHNAYVVYKELPDSLNGKYQQDYLNEYYNFILYDYVPKPNNTSVSVNKDNNDSYYYQVSEYYTKYVNIDTNIEYYDEIKSVLDITEYTLPYYLSPFYLNNQNEEYAIKGLDFIKEIINNPNIKLKIRNYNYKYYNTYDNYIEYNLELEYKNEYYLYKVKLILGQETYLEYDIRNVEEHILNSIQEQYPNSTINITKIRDLLNSYDWKVEGYDSLASYEVTIDNCMIPIIVYREARHLTSLEIIDKDYVIIIDDNWHDLEYIYSPTNSSYQEIEWTSSDPDVLIVNEYGQVKGISKGTTLIRAMSITNSNIYDSVWVEVISISEAETIEKLKEFPDELDTAYSTEIYNLYLKDILTKNINLDGFDFEYEDKYNGSVVISLKKKRFRFLVN